MSHLYYCTKKSRSHVLLSKKKCLSHHVLHRSHPGDKYCLVPKSSEGQHGSPHLCKYRIRSRGGVRILCWPVTPAVQPLSKLGIRGYLSSKPVWKRQSTTNHTAYGQVIICSRKKVIKVTVEFAKIMILNDIHFNDATSPFLFVFCLVLKSPHT
jgi:hypothetical protein